MEYSPNIIEKHWQKYWKENQIYKVSNDSTKPKYYVLDMFPYPSGAGLHVGHPMGYIATDIFTRFKRLKGFNVLHPMGYDAFGLPAEQYAIQTGVHPAESTAANIVGFRRQMDNIGFSYDWSREVNTSDPAYYKWTQWIFLQLFDHYYDTKLDKARPLSDLISHFETQGSSNVTASNSFDGSFTAEEWTSFSAKEKDEVLMNYRLVYRKVGYVNWCEALGTVLANDEVKDGVSERGGYPVMKKAMMQWSLRTTAYAERLLKGLDDVEWPESLKIMQRNWIGRSEGARVFFQVKDHPNLAIEIFTTRPDTIFGATFMVLAPEHDWVERLTTEACREGIEQYKDYVQSRSERERVSEVKKVSGAFTGAYAIHPISGNEIPVWISEYVLKDYGTGAIMAVPSDDSRDNAFAKHFKLPIIEVIDRSAFPNATMEDKVGHLMNSDFLNGKNIVEAIAAALDYIEHNGLGTRQVNFRLRDANFSRQRYWGEPFPILYDPEGVAHAVDVEDLPLELPKLDDFKPSVDGKAPLTKALEWLHPIDGWVREADTMPGFAGSSWYFLRYMDPENPEAFASKQALDYWQDVDLYVGGAEHAVGHLLYSRTWHKFLFDIGKVPTPEPFRKLINQGMIQGRSNFIYRANDKFFMAYLEKKVFADLMGDIDYVKETKSDFESATNYDYSIKGSNLVIEVTSFKQSDKIARIREIAAANGKRLLVIANETISRNINNPKHIEAIIRENLHSSVPFVISEYDKEPGQLYVSHNLTYKYDESNFSAINIDVNWLENDVLDIEKALASNMYKNADFKLDPNGKFTCSWEIEKMSKSKYNVVNPDHVIGEYGADCFRMYEMFLGPVEQSKPWDMNGIDGVAKFLRRFWSLYASPDSVLLTNDAPAKPELKILHTAIKKVTEDIEKFSFNTSVSAFMICVNELKKLNCSKREILEPLTILIAPFAPHVSEEIWQNILNNEGTVFDASFPSFDEQYLKDDEIDYPLCINGKKRAIMSFPAEENNANIENAAKSHPDMEKWLEGKSIKKVIIVPGKMINVVA